MRLIGGMAAAALLALGMAACASSSGASAPAATPSAPPAAQPATAPAAQPSAADGGCTGAARGRAAARRSAGRGRRPRRSWHPTAPAADAPVGDAEAGDADRRRDRAHARSARRPQGRLVGCRRGGVEHAHGLDDAAARQVAGRDPLRPRVLQQVRHPGALQRLRHLRHLEPPEARAGAELRLPRLAERRVGLQEPAVHVVGGARTAGPIAASAACPSR